MPEQEAWKPEIPAGAQGRLAGFPEVPEIIPKKQPGAKQPEKTTSGQDKLFEVEPDQTSEGASRASTRDSSRGPVPVTGSYQRQMADRTRTSTDQNERLRQQSELLKQPTQEAPPRAVAASKEMVDGVSQKRVDEAGSIPADHEFSEQ